MNRRRRANFSSGPLNPTCDQTLSSNTDRQDLQAVQVVGTWHAQAKSPFTFVRAGEQMHQTNAV